MSQHTRNMNRAHAAVERMRGGDPPADRLYHLLAYFDTRDGTPLAALVRAAREGYERSGSDMAEDGAWDEFDARWANRHVDVLSLSKENARLRTAMIAALDCQQYTPASVEGHDPWTILRDGLNA